MESYNVFINSNIDSKQVDNESEGLDTSSESDDIGNMYSYSDDDMEDIQEVPVKEEKDQKEIENPVMPKHSFNPYLLHRMQQQKLVQQTSNGYTQIREDTQPTQLQGYNTQITQGYPQLNRSNFGYTNHFQPMYRRKFQELDDKRKPEGMVGLTNLGNTCYMNSVLQCLFNTPVFKDIISNQEIIKELYTHVTNKLGDEDKKNYSAILAHCQLTITFQMYKLINAIWSNKTKHIRPINFRNVFANKIENFQSFEQQDSQEALLCILDTIHTELQRTVEIEYDIFSKEYLDMFKKIEEEPDKYTDIECCQLETELPDFWELLSLKRALDKYNNKSYSFVTNLFQNVVSSTLQCPDCNYHTYNFDPSIILTIPIPNERKVDMTKIEAQLEKLKYLPEERIEQIRRHLIMSQCNNQTFKLEECFANLVHTEQLDDTNKWFCSYCNDKVNAYKKLSIWIPPKIMIIQIKRFIQSFTPMGYSANKLNNTIEYPIYDFDLTPYMSSCSKKLGEKTNNFTYDLIGVSNHIGNLNGGHYFSYVKSLTDGNWYCTDDDSVTLMSEEDVVSSNAYILFYKQRESDITL